jgi:ribosome maturation factor RimP
LAKKRRSFAPGKAGGSRPERNRPERGARNTGNAPAFQRSDGESVHGQAEHGSGGTVRSAADWGVISERVQRLLEAPIANLGCRLLDVIYRHEGRWVLRLVIDKPSRPDGAVTLDDCGDVSEVAGRILDVDDPIPNRFSLEVTSPGVFRLLKERKHFEQSVGKLVRFTLAPEVHVDRKDRTVRGLLEAVTDDGVRMRINGEELTAPLDAVRSARLDPDL